MELGVSQQVSVQGGVLLGAKMLTTMAKPGRNDPCPCGSGNKYKKCCLAKEEAVAREQLAKAEARRIESTVAHRLHLREVRAAIAARLSEDADEDELTVASNAAAELVRAGKLDEAEQAARDLLVRFPDVHDGYDRLGMVYEARGDNRQAADCYRKVIAFIREHPDDYEPGFEDVFVKLVNRLDPPAAT
jgi:tetratricopeptide (TPR) repeat protein